MTAHQRILCITIFLFSVAAAVAEAAEATSASVSGDKSLPFLHQSSLTYWPLGDFDGILGK